MAGFNDARDFQAALERLRQRQTLARVLAPILIIALALAADAAWKQRRRARALAEAGRAWAAYQRCVLGEPLAEGEQPTLRLGRIEMNLPEPEREPPIAPWPARCSHFLSDLREALDRGHLSGKEPFAELDRDAKAAAADLAPEATPDLPNHLWAAALAARLPEPLEAPPPDAPAAPSYARPLTASTLPPLPLEVLAAPEEVEAVRGEGVRLLFATTSGESTLCSFRRDERGQLFRTAHCADNVVPAQTEDGTSGFLRNVKGRFDKFELIRPVLGADAQIITLPAGAHGIAMYVDQLVWITGSRHLFARLVPQGTGELGDPVDLGEVKGSSPELSACRSETSLIVRIKSYGDEPGPGRVWTSLAMRTGASWDRVPGETIVAANADFTCRGREATFTSIERDVIRQTRCTPESCVSSASDRLGLRWDSGRELRVSDLDGRAILVGIGMTAGPVVQASVKTVRMRIAPVADIASAPDTVVLGDRAHDGLDATDLHLYAGRGAALVLVTTSDREAYRAITVHADGKFEGLKVDKL